MTFSTNQVAEAAQVSLRQLQWWDERKLVDVVHEGHRRVYDREDAFKVVLVGKMRAKGLSLQVIRKVLKSLNVSHLEQNPRSLLIIRCAAKTRWMLWYNDSDIAEQLHKENGPVVIIAIAPLLAAVPTEPAPLPKGRARKTKYKPGIARAAHGAWMRGTAQ